MKKQLLTLLSVCTLALSAYAQRHPPYAEDMGRGLDGDTKLYEYSYACGGIGQYTTSLGQTVQELTVSATAKGATPSLYTMVMDSIGGANVYDECYGFMIVSSDSTAADSLDVSGLANVYVHFKLKSTVAFTLVTALNDGINSTDASNYSASVTATDYYKWYDIKIGAFSTWDGKTVDKTKIKAIQIIPNKGSAPAVNGTIVLDKILIDNNPTTSIINSIGSTKSVIAPNPASSMATVSYQELAGSNVVVNVSDMVGNVVKSVNGEAKSANFSVADLTKGIYFVTVVVDGAPVSVEKLVVE